MKPKNTYNNNTVTYAVPEAPSNSSNFLGSFILFFNGIIILVAFSINITEPKNEDKLLNEPIGFSHFKGLGSYVTEYTITDIEMMFRMFINIEIGTK